MEYWKQELYHHGILGMKLGKRNGPPYPLSPGQHSESEKKAGWRKSLGGKKNPELYRQAKKQAKVNRKARDQKIRDEYDRTEARIEKNYKRGQQLSDRDYAREMAADDKARKAWAKSKEQYKNDLRIAKDKFGANKAGSLAEKEQNLIDTAKEKWKSDWKSDDRSYLGIAGGTLVRNLAIGAGAAAVAVGIMYMRSGGTEMLGNFDIDVLGYMKGLKDVEIVGNIANLAIKAGTVSAVAKIGHKFYKDKIENKDVQVFNDKKKNEREPNRPSDWKETRRSYDPGVDKKNMTYHEKYNEFLDAYTPNKNSPNSLYDIDDEELIRVHMDDPNFRKEYGVNSTDYKIWKDIMGD